MHVILGMHRHGTVVLASIHNALLVFSLRHILFTPQSYHVGVRETFSFTSYASERFEVVARVSFDTCTCSDNRVRRCRDRGDVFSEARGMVKLGMVGCLVDLLHCNTILVH